MSDQLTNERVQAVEVRVQIPTDENFSPYGQVLSRAAPILPHVEPGEGHVAIEMTKLEADWRRPHLEEMAVHFSYNQTFIMLKGTQIIVVAPAPTNRSDAVQSYDLQYDKIAAFIVAAGEAVMINEGIWHNNIPLGSVVYANVTRKNPAEGTTRVPPPGMITREREYVGSVNFRKRDGKIIKVVF